MTTTRPSGMPTNRVVKMWQLKRSTCRFLNRAVSAYMDNAKLFNETICEDFRSLTYEMYDDSNGKKDNQRTMRKKSQAIEFFEKRCLKSDKPKTNTDRLAYLYQNFYKFVDVAPLYILFCDDYALYCDINAGRLHCSSCVVMKGLPLCMTDWDIKRFQPMFGIRSNDSEMMMSQDLYHWLDPTGLSGQRDYYKNDFIFLLGASFLVSDDIATHHIYLSLTHYAPKYQDCVRSMMALYTAELFVSHLALTASKRRNTRKLTRAASTVRSPVTNYSQLKLFARTLMYLMQFFVVGTDQTVYESLMTDYKNLIIKICNKDYVPDTDYAVFNETNLDDNEYCGATLNGAERLLVEFLECFVLTTNLFLPWKMNNEFFTNIHEKNRWPRTFGLAKVDLESNHSGTCYICGQKVYSTRAHLCMMSKNYYHVKYFDFSNDFHNYVGDTYNVHGYILMDLDLRNQKVIPNKFLLWNSEFGHLSKEQADIVAFNNFFAKKNHVELLCTYIFGTIGKVKSVPKFRNVILLEC